jgi:DNA modification methylase
VIHHGDCVEVMAGMDPESVDAIVTDPPYGLEFMGKEWDQFKDLRGRGVGASFGDMLFKDSGQMPNFGGRWMNKRCRLCGHIQSGGSPCRCPEPDWVREYEQGSPKHAVAYGAWSRAWAEAAYRVAKPSAYLLAFGGTRTVHRMTVALEDSGWIIRDMLVWGYASGFPKSKASLKPAWEPIVMARKPGPLRMLAIDECRIGFASDDDRESAEALQRLRLGHPGGAPTYGGGKGMPPPTTEGVNPAGRWPANIVLTDPIFDGGVEGVVGGGSPTPGRSQNVLTPSDGTDGTRAYGSGIGRREVGWKEAYDDSGTYSRFFAIPGGTSCDWCGVSIAGSSSLQPSRSGASAPSDAPTSGDGLLGSTDQPMASPTTSGTETTSWLADAEPTTRTRSSPGSQRAELNLSSDPANNAARLGTSFATTRTTTNRPLCSSCAVDAMRSFTDERASVGSREKPIAFLIPKAARSDREPVLGGLEERVINITEGHGLGPVNTSKGGDGIRENRPRANVHPTVKPTDLMRHLVRLVTPTGGVVLDPFLGSGTTGLAAEMEGFDWIGIEREAEYVAIAEARLNGTQRGLGLEAS